MKSLVFLAWLTLVGSERVYQDVVFTRATCEQLGGDALKFEACAIMEFCVNPNARAARRIQDPDDEWWSKPPPNEAQWDSPSEPGNPSDPFTKQANQEKAGEIAQEENAETNEVIEKVGDMGELPGGEDIGGISGGDGLEGSDMGGLSETEDTDLPGAGQDTGGNPIEGDMDTYPEEENDLGNYPGEEEEEEEMGTNPEEEEMGAFPGDEEMSDNPGGGEFGNYPGEGEEEDMSGEEEGVSGEGEEGGMSGEGGIPGEGEIGNYPGEGEEAMPGGEEAMPGEGEIGNYPGEGEEEEAMPSEEGGGGGGGGETMPGEGEIGSYPGEGGEKAMPGSSSSQQGSPSGSASQPGSTPGSGKSSPIQNVQGTYSEAAYGWRLPGSSECLAPGPVMRLKRGVHQGLFVKGAGGDTSTNLHFHGLHIAGNGNADDVHRHVDGDDVLIYDLNLPADSHLGGTHWYHSHLYGSALQQIKGGAFGMIVIDDNGHDVGTDDENVLAFLKNERLLILDDTKGSWTANGNDGGVEVYSFLQNEWIRLRVLLVGTNSHRSGGKLKIGDGCTAHAIAHDGIFRFDVPKDQSQSEFFLTASSRLDLAIRCASDTSISVTGDPVAKIQVASGGDSGPTPFESGTNTWKSNRLAYVDDLSNATPDNHWSVYVQETAINDLHFHQGKPLCNDDGNDFSYGTIQEWVVDGARVHPFHTHIFHMQVMNNACGDAHDVGEFYDTIVTSKHNGFSGASSYDGSGDCKVRLHFVDVNGPMLMHCHIVEHAEEGAMGWINVEGGGVDQPSEPRVQECKSGGNCDPPVSYATCATGRKV